MDIDSRFRDERLGIPNPQDVATGDKDAASPILEGRMYEITKYIDSDGKKYAAKVLRPEMANSTYYPNRNLESIFYEHIEEHKIFLECFGDMVEPCDFYVEMDNDGNTQYCVVQPWIEDGVQYKEARKTGRMLSESQFPDLGQRLKFLQGLGKMFETKKNMLPDLDFLVCREKEGVRIRVFDTTGFWFERKGGKDRNEMVSSIKGFLFKKEELANPDVAKALEALYIQPDYY